MQYRPHSFFTLLLLLSALFFCGCISGDSNPAEINQAFEFYTEYSHTVCPGDPIFLSITLSEAYRDLIPDNAVVTLFRITEDGEKQLNQQHVTPVRQNPLVLFTEFPTSTWAEPGLYQLEVTCTDDPEQAAVFLLPITMVEKEFVSETLYLNATNTAIKTNNSPARATQIDRLNEILFTTNPHAVYYDGLFMEPCESRRYTSFFGDRRVYQYNTGKSSTSLHYGVDYGVPVGTDVWACGAGKVVMAEERISTGWSVVIEHLPGLYSLYYHMDSLCVESGQMVKKGEEIGKSGCTGLATGPHLHWEVRLAGEAVNPHFYVENLLF